MFSRWLLALLVLPGTVLVSVPLGVTWVSAQFGLQVATAGLKTFQFWLALALAVAGILLAVWTNVLFFRVGRGTPAPWDPPTRFVVRGPYRHVRNPMIVGVVLMLAAESLFFRSWPLAAWTGLFFLGNSIYFPLVEEPRLAARFGEDYAVYCQNVGRWVPRLMPWIQADVAASSQSDTETD